jgi:hypothetical protein
MYSKPNRLCTGSLVWYISVLYLVVGISTYSTNVTTSQFAVLKKMKFITQLFQYLHTRNRFITGNIKICKVACESMYVASVYSFIHSQPLHEMEVSGQLYLWGYILDGWIPKLFWTLWQGKNHCHAGYWSLVIQCIVTLFTSEISWCMQQMCFCSERIFITHTYQMRSLRYHLLFLSLEFFKFCNLTSILGVLRLVCIFTSAQ